MRQFQNWHLRLHSSLLTYYYTKMNELSSIQASSAFDGATSTTHWREPKIATDQRPTTGNNRHIINSFAIILNFFDSIQISFSFVCVCVYMTDPFHNAKRFSARLFCVLK